MVTLNFLLPAPLTEHDKETYDTVLKKQVYYYGLENFFCLLTSDWPTKTLLDGAHLFEIDTVLAEYESRILTHTPVIDPTTNAEMPESIFAGQRAYDEYEKCDIALSRLVIESLILEAFGKTIKTCFSHHNKFDTLPGQVYFVMILDALQHICHY